MDASNKSDIDFDSYWDEEARNPNRNRIRIGRQYQAQMPPMLKSGESDGRQLEELETITWTPQNQLSQCQLNHYFAIAKSIGLFIQALDTCQDGVDETECLNQEHCSLTPFEIKNSGTKCVLEAKSDQRLQQLTTGANNNNNNNTSTVSVGGNSSFLSQNNVNNSNTVVGPNTNSHHHGNSNNNNNSSSPDKQSVTTRQRLHKEQQQQNKHQNTNQQKSDHREEEMAAASSPLENSPNTRIQSIVKDLPSFILSHHALHQKKKCKFNASLQSNSASSSIINLGSSAKYQVQTLSKLLTGRWKESDAAVFAQAIEKCGKNFSAIKKDYLPWKSVRNIIEFYYSSIDKEKELIKHNQNQQQQSKRKVDLLPQQSPKTQCKSSSSGGSGGGENNNNNNKRKYPKGASSSSSAKTDQQPNTSKQRNNDNKSVNNDNNSNNTTATTTTTSTKTMTNNNNNNNTTESSNNDNDDDDETNNNEENNDENEHVKCDDDDDDDGDGNEENDRKNGDLPKHFDFSKTSSSSKSIIRNNNDDSTMMVNEEQDDDKTKPLTNGNGCPFLLHSPDAKSSSSSSLMSLQEVSPLFKGVQKSKNNHQPSSTGSDNFSDSANLLGSLNLYLHGELVLRLNAQQQRETGQKTWVESLELPVKKKKTGTLSLNGIGGGGVVTSVRAGSKRSHDKLTTTVVNSTAANFKENPDDLSIGVGDGSASDDDDSMTSDESSSLVASSPSSSSTITTSAAKKARVKVENLNSFGNMNGNLTVQPSSSSPNPSMQNGRKSIDLTPNGLPLAASNKSSSLPILAYLDTLTAVADLDLKRRLFESYQLSGMVGGSPEEMFSHLINAAAVAASSSSPSPVTINEPPRAHSNSSTNSSCISPNSLQFFSPVKNSSKSFSPEPLISSSSMVTPNGYSSNGFASTSNSPVDLTRKSPINQTEILMVSNTKNHHSSSASPHSSSSSSNRHHGAKSHHNSSTKTHSDSLSNRSASSSSSLFSLPAPPPPPSHSQSLNVSAANNNSHHHHHHNNHHPHHASKPLKKSAIR